jgi:Flp pilus assembly protein TadG
MKRRLSNMRHQKGVAAVEFALMLPLFLTLLFGVIELSFAMYDKAIITNASREAARAGIVVAKPRVSSTKIGDVASGYVSGLLVTFGSSAAPTVSVDQSEGTTAGKPLKVTVSYTYNGLLLTSLITGLVGPIKLDAATVMTYE